MASPGAPRQSLTPREAEVFEWMILGKRDSEIARIIDASPRTAEKHVASILAKFGVETRGAAVSIYYEAIIAGLKKENADLKQELRRGKRRG
jgi:DNA-binding CsgD family transcriptional regulator